MRLRNPCAVARLASIIFKKANTPGAGVAATLHLHGFLRQLITLEEPLLHNIDKGEISDRYETESAH